MISFASLASIIWTGIIALTLYLSVVKDRLDVDQHFRLFFLVTVSLALLGALLPLTTNSFGPGDGWCWIQETGEMTETIWSLALFYIPLWLIFIANIFIYIRVIMVINEEMGDLREQSLLRRELVRRLIIYPMILLLCFLPVTVKRIYEFIHQCSPFELFYVSGFFASSVGFCNSIAYGFNPTVRS